MNTWFSTMLLAVVSGTVTTLAVLGVCRINGLAPLVKVWLCRACLAKWPLGCLGGIGIAFGPAIVSGTGTTPTWVDALASIVFALWVVGALATGADALMAWLRVRSVVLSVPRACPQFSSRVSRWASTVGVRGRFDTRSSEISPALVMAAPHRVLSLPADCSDFVVLHELAHLRNRDIGWTGFAATVGCLFWFHPLVEALARELRLWQDVVADRQAMRLSGTGVRDASEDVLRSTASESSVVAALALGSEARDFARRFTEMRPRRRHWAVVVAALVAAGATMVPIVPSAREAEPTGPILAQPARRMVSPARSSDVPIATMAEY